MAINKQHSMKNYQAKPMPWRCTLCGDIKRPVAQFYVNIAPHLGICVNCINQLRKGSQTALAAIEETKA